MLRHTKFYIFSHRSLDLKEVRHFKSKVLGFGAVAGLGIIAALLVLNHFGGDVLGLGIDRMSMLTAENRILKDQIRLLGDKVAVVQKALEKLSDRGNELRTAVDLTRIDDDTRAAAIGGAVPPAVNAFLSGEAREVLSGSASLLDKLEREVKLELRGNHETDGIQQRPFCAYPGDQADERAVFAQQLRDAHPPGAARLQNA